MKTWIKRGLVGVAVVSLVGVASLSKLKPLDVDVVAVKKQDVSTSVVEKGKITSVNTQNIYTELSGKVENVYVEEGDKVTKGTLLAQLDVEELEARLSQFKGELKAIAGSERAAQSQSGVNQIKQQEATVAQARSSLKLAQSNYERTKALYAEGAATTVELEQSETALENARKTLEQAEAALAATLKQSQSNALQYQGQKESLQAQIDYLSGQISKGKIYANADGVIFTKKVQAGDFVNIGTLLYTVGNSGEKEIETWIDSKDMANVKLGDKVQIIIKGPGKDVRAEARIIKIAPVSEERTSSLGLVEDRIKVTLVPSKLPGEVRMTPGSSVDVQLITSQVNEVVAVPKDAVFTDNGQDYLWTVREGKAVLTKVETGLEGDLLVEVKKGLQAGEQVILNPHEPNLKEGTKVN